MKRMAGMLVLLTSLGGCGLFHKENTVETACAAKATGPSANKDLSSKELVLSPSEAKKPGDAGDKKPGGDRHSLPDLKSPSKPATILPDSLPASPRSQATPGPAAAVPRSTPAPATAAQVGQRASTVFPGTAPAAPPSPALPAANTAALPPLPAASGQANPPLRPVDYKVKAPEGLPSLQQPLVLDQPKTGANPPAVRVLNSKHILLDFVLRDSPAVPMAGVELWYTRDAQMWIKHPSPLQRRSPVVVDVVDDGTYGFTLVACGEAGPITKRPQNGDLPQAWVVVDVTPPAVNLTSVEARGDLRDRKLAILWKATDANLGARPITLSYADSAAGPWTLIAANLANSGYYQWSLPAGLPSRILIRVEAADEVGNIGVAQTPEPIIVDLSQPSRPRVAILTIEPMEAK